MNEMVETDDETIEREKALRDEIRSRWEALEDVWGALDPYGTTDDELEVHATLFENEARWLVAAVRRLARCEP